MSQDRFWSLERRPNTFAEQYRWLAVCTNQHGYQIDKKGFQTKTEAVKFIKEQKS